MTTERKKWTLMFFFAGDNTLSPAMLSQIKAIKEAGYQRDTNVVLYFDPNERGAPTRVFEVNRNDRVKGMPSRIGDCGRRLVSVLTGDDITSLAIDESTVDTLSATDAFENFLEFCRNSYPAEHYMLFLVGHGMVVGRDAFLPDENPRSSITLGDLGRILTTFSNDIRGKGVLELIAMHSCAMSSVEISYQLQNTARFLLGSQGISFIGAWPYRQLLIKIFNAVEEERTKSTPVKVLPLLESLHDLCIQHSADYMVGGYSADLCLSTLNSTNVGNLNEPIATLAEALRDGLKDERGQQLILLAHLKSQSYWQETYTDLYDFCLCLSRLCLSANGDKTQQAMEAACQGVIEKLKPKQPTAADGPVIRSDFIGAGYQYSHGLSIYFPWTKPIEDKNERALTNYEGYAFSQQLANSAWLKFLCDYFKETERFGRLKEDDEPKDAAFKQALDDARDAFKFPGAVGPESVPSLTLDGKVTPPDSGGSCSCPSLKNHSREFVMSFNAAAVFMGRDTRPAARPATAP